MSSFAADVTYEDGTWTGAVRNPSVRMEAASPHELRDALSARIRELNQVPDHVPVNVILIRL
ncbi:hypothetical protein [Leifsonia sp. Leaf264]|uniref:hypothetical protein n=1 Tax=Leifsonia sp. Leaf264 TaxID=1736314 RepID=UPI0006F894B2|nr:hypothetical protein [Leifsonia sp. Leaf264]KQO98802.1 hypothetical protein ASF30_12125 [Leifsonia sp. Leaf264]